MDANVQQKTKKKKKLLFYMESRNAADDLEQQIP